MTNLIKRTSGKLLVIGITFFNKLLVIFQQSYFIKFEKKQTILIEMYDIRAPTKQSVANSQNISDPVEQ